MLSLLGSIALPLSTPAFHFLKLETSFASHIYVTYSQSRGILHHDLPNNERQVRLCSLSEESKCLEAEAVSPGSGVNT